MNVIITNKDSLSCDTETKIVNPNDQIGNEPLLLMDTLPEVSGKKAKEILNKLLLSKYILL